MLIDNDLTIPEIAKNLNVSSATVKNRLKLFGLQTTFKSKSKLLAKKYSDEQLLEAYHKSRSLTQMLLNLGVNTSGGAFYHYKKRLINLGIDIAEFINNKSYLGGEITAISRNQAAIKRKKRLPRHCLHKHMTLHNIVEKCIKCGISDWQEIPLKLHIHHKDHDKTNNNIDNLEYLCPNCHSIEHYNSE